MKAIDTNMLAGLASAEAKRKEELIPAGFVKIELSTKGKVGAPASFHIRNFNTRDIATLSLTEESELPFRLIELLEDLIYEKDIDVSSFHEAEVVETLVRVYIEFYGKVLIDVEFPYDETDIKFLRDTLPEAAANEKIADLEAGRWTPRTDIHLNKLSGYDLPEDFKPSVSITNKKSGFSVTFGMPKFGDVLTVRQWADRAFETDRLRFARIEQMINLRDKMLAQYEQGQQVDLNRLPSIDPANERAYNEFLIDQGAVLVDVIRALHLKAFDGKDVSALPLAERAKLVADPRLDVTLAEQADKYFSELKIGLEPVARMDNPITGEKDCQKAYSFRLVDILQAIQSSESDEYDIVFGG